MEQDASDILTHAIERNLAAVLSLPSAGMMRHYKSRFIRESHGGVWMEAVAKERPLIESLIREEKPAVVSFKVETRKVTFASAVLEFDLDFWLNASKLVPAVRLKRPAKVLPVQRRNSYRVPIQATDGITVQVWRITNEADLNGKPAAMAMLPAVPHNLSVGGIGIEMTAEDGQPPRLTTGERLRILLQLPDQAPLLIEGRAGQIFPVKDGRYQVGVDFKGLQDRLEGRQIMTDLTKIVGALHRKEIKRIRRMCA